MGLGTEPRRACRLLWRGVDRRRAVPSLKLRETVRDHFRVAVNRILDQDKTLAVRVNVVLT